MIVRELTTKLNFEADDKKIGGFTKMIAGLTAGLTAAAVASTAIRRMARGLADETASYGDEVAKTSRKLGVSVKGLQSYRFAFDRSGVSAEEFTKSMEFLNRTIGQNPDETRTVEELLPKIADRFKNMTSESEKAALAMKYFGRSGMGMVLGLQEGSDGLAALQDEYEALGGGMTDEAAKSAEEYTDAVTNLKAAIKGVRIEIGSQLMPIFQKLIETRTEFIKQNRELISKTVVATIKLSFNLFQNIFGIFKKIFNFIMPAIQWTSDFILEFFRRFRRDSRDATSFISRVLLFFRRVGISIRDAIVAVVRLAGVTLAFMADLIYRSGSKVLDFLGNVRNRFVSLMFAVSGFEEELEESNNETSTFMDYLRALGKWAAPMIDSLKDSVIELFESFVILGKAIWGALAELFNFPDGSHLNTAADVIREISKWIRDVLVGVVKKFILMFAVVKTVLAEVWDVINKVVDRIGGWGEVLKGIVVFIGYMIIVKLISMTITNYIKSAMLVLLATFPELATILIAVGSVLYFIYTTFKTILIFVAKAIFLKILLMFVSKNLFVLGKTVGGIVKVVLEAYTFLFHGGWVIALGKFFAKWILLGSIIFGFAAIIFGVVYQLINWLAFGQGYLQDALGDWDEFGKRIPAIFERMMMQIHHKFTKPLVAGLMMIGRMLWAFVTLDFVMFAIAYREMKRFFTEIVVHLKNAVVTMMSVLQAMMEDFFGSGTSTFITRFFYQILSFVFAFIWPYFVLFIKYIGITIDFIIRGFGWAIRGIFGLVFLIADMIRGLIFWIIKSTVHLLSWPFIVAIKAVMGLHPIFKSIFDAFFGLVALAAFLIVHSVTSVFRFLLDSVSRFVGFIKKYWFEIATIFTVIAMGATGVLGVMLRLLLVFSRFIIKHFNKIVDSFVSVGNRLWIGLIAFLGFMLEEIMNFIRTIYAFSLAIALIFRNFLIDKVFLTVFHWIKKQGNRVISFFVTGIRDSLKAILFAVSLFFAKVTNFFNRIIKSVFRFFDRIIVFFVTLIATTVSYFKRIHKSLVEFLVEFFTKTKDFFVALFFASKQMTSDFVGWLDGIIDSIARAILHFIISIFDGTLWPKMKKTFKSLMDFLSSYFVALKEIFNAIINLISQIAVDMIIALLPKPIAKMLGVNQGDLDYGSDHGGRLVDFNSDWIPNERMSFDDQTAAMGQDLMRENNNRTYYDNKQYTINVPEGNTEEQVGAIKKFVEESMNQQVDEAYYALDGR